MTTKPDLTRIWADNAIAAKVVDPDTITPGKFEDGWELAEVPPFEYFNFLQQLFTQGLAHANEEGVMVWDTDTPYPQFGFCKGSNSRLYIAKSAQDGNDPISSPTFWAEISFNQKVVRQTGGGNLIPMVVNYIEDSNTYDLPEADTVADGIWVKVTLSDKNSAQEPTVQVTGTDDLEDIIGVDPDGEFLFDAGTSFEVDFISNGVDTWEI